MSKASPEPTEVRPRDPRERVAELCEKNGVDRFSPRNAEGHVRALVDQESKMLSLVEKQKLLQQMGRAERLARLLEAYPEEAMIGVHISGQLEGGDVSRPKRRAPHLAGIVSGGSQHELLGVYEGADLHGELDVLVISPLFVKQSPEKKVVSYEAFGALKPDGVVVHDGSQGVEVVEGAGLLAQRMNETFSQAA